MIKEIFRKGLVFGIILLFIGASGLPVVNCEFFGNDNASTMVKTGILSASMNVITVDDEGDGDYTRIQDAIDTANPEDTIEVYSGTYIENVVIDKTLNLIGIASELRSGDDIGKPIVDGRGRGVVVSIFGERVKISNFSVKNSRRTFFTYGIAVRSSNNQIVNCIIRDNSLGISLIESSYNYIDNCTIYDSMTCIYLHYSFNNYVSDCTIYNNQHGISFSESNNNCVRDSILHTSYVGGISLDTSNYNQIQNCEVSKSLTGLYIQKSPNTQIENSTVYKNSYGIFLRKSSNIVIENCMIYNNNLSGINMQLQSSDNKIKDCEIYSNGWNGIAIDSSSDNSVIKCQIYNNNWYGMDLEDSLNIDIIDNTFINNGLYISEDDPLNKCIHRIENNSVNGKPLLYFINENGITLDDIEAGQLILVNCHNCSVKNLDLSNTDVGIEALYSSDNIFYLNNFANNTRHAIDNGYNQWDNGSVGNYWDDYYGWDYDGDGIGDTPYNIPPYSKGNLDRYPTGKFQMDNTAPEVSIIRPIEGQLYLFNHKLWPTPSGNTIIYGGFTLEINARDFESGLYYVEFSIDDEVKEREYYEPDKVTYEWKWDETAFGERRTINVMAFDRAGNSASDELDVIVWNIRLPQPPG